MNSVEKSLDSVKVGNKTKLLTLYAPSPSLLHSKIISGIPNTSNSKLTNYFQVSFTNYPFKNFPKLGYGVGVSYSNLTSSISSESLTDTLSRDAYDPTGQQYTRVAYSKDLKENISISYASVLFNISYKILPWKSTESQWFVSLNPGVKLSNILTSTYNATDGHLWWGGYYQPDNSGDKKDTSYSGMYDFYVNQPVDKGTRHLQLNSSFISFFVSVDFVTRIKNKLNFNLSIYGDWGTNMLINYPNQSLLSSTKDDYNSLIYRSKQFKINSYGVRGGLSYSF